MYTANMLLSSHRRLRFETRFARKFFFRNKQKFGVRQQLKTNADILVRLTTHVEILWVETDVKYMEH